MSLTAGSGPFGRRPAGRFDFTPDPPTGAVLLWEPVPQRLRALVAGETLFATRDARLLHETGHLPVSYVPVGESRTRCPRKGEASYWTIRTPGRTVPDAVWAFEEPLEPASFLGGHAALDWHVADEWFAEDEQLFGHPRDPYHRLDVYRTSRRIHVVTAGETAADSVRTRALFETGHPVRHSFPSGDVRLEAPRAERAPHDGEPVRDLLCFDERYVHD